MSLLRRLLKAQAALWFVTGAVACVGPGWLVERVLGQPPLQEDAWLRIAGVMAVVLAMFMVLVSQRLEDVWWWAWTVVLLEAGTATVALLNALVSLPPGAAAWPWWLLFVLNAGFAAGGLVALARGAREKPFA
jgi:hypothetical protein